MNGEELDPVREHYDTHLAPIYSWMLGDVDQAEESARSELESLGLSEPGAGIAIDLGAGTGIYSMALARLGYDVTACDNCVELVEGLRSRAQGLSIDAVAGDLRAFRGKQSGKAEVIVCMGDTLTHLDREHSVVTLFSHVRHALGAAGTFVASFRDYTDCLSGTDRFIPVRSDSNRVLTCFLEYHDKTVWVHDIIHERDDSAWTMRVSRYPKLRISPAWASELLASQGFDVRSDSAPGGMTRVVARVRQ